MENEWQFRGNEEGGVAAAVTFGSFLGPLNALCDFNNPDKPVLTLGHGDPSYYPEFRTAIEAENAVVEAVRSAEYNHYPSGGGITQARQALADYLNRDLPTVLDLELPQLLKPSDVFLAVGCNQGTELIIQAIARPNANILIPRPGYPQYECRAIYSKVEVRKYDLLEEDDWQFDFAGIERLANENTVAIVIINPHNPCGNVYSIEQLRRLAHLAKKLGIMVISDEVYRNIVYGPNTFVPMGMFNSIAPVITLGALSKGWIVPGWRVGWIAAHDHKDALKNTGVIQSIIDHVAISPNPTAFLQGALPDIFLNTRQEFFNEKCDLFSANVDYLYDLLKDFPALTVIKKPEACTYLLARLNLCRLEGITDDLDFCRKLASEENLVILPGTAVGSENLVRITIGVERWMLEAAFNRLQAFYERHSAEVSICPKTES